MVVAAVLAAAQTGGLVNGGFEEGDANGRPKGWVFPEVTAKAGYRASVAEDGAASGKRCGTLTSPEKPAQGMFGNLMQSLDAARWRGKRVRFRAAVRTENLGADGRAQLWLRVDRKAAGAGGQKMGAFDNMDRRPIRSDVWKTYEIVARVDDDAERINVGLLLLGAGTARIDDVVFEEADAAAAVTAVAPEAAAKREELEDPIQPVLCPWLALAAAIASLLASAHLPPSLFQRFAFRFAFAYWLLYFLPSPFQGFKLGAAFTQYAGWAFTHYEKGWDTVVRWSAVHVLGITRTLIPPGGSGDTTYDYVRLLVIAALSAVIAIGWWLADRRAHPVAADLLRSYLRYTVGITLLGYGLAKMTEAVNQFPAPSVDQLAKSYGESSPMNLLWTFMGASPAYTRFSGLCEMAPAFLLAWRRTALVGALAAAAVMLNVFVLNLAYDVPVKQYSGHLLFASVWLALPSAPRLVALLLGRGAVPAEELGPPYVRGRWKWLHRATVVALFVFGFALPAREVYLKAQEPVEQEPAYVGSYAVESFRRGGKEVDPANPARWKRVSIFRARSFAPGEAPREILLVTSGEKNQQFFSRLKTTAADGSIVPENPPPGGPASFAWQFDKDLLVLRGDGLEAKLKRVRREDFLLVRRGFRWINERPFNR